MRIRFRCQRESEARRAWRELPAARDAGGYNVASPAASARLRLVVAGLRRGLSKLRPYKILVGRELARAAAEEFREGGRKEGLSSVVPRMRDDAAGGERGGWSVF